MNTRHVLTFFDPEGIVRLLKMNPVVWHHRDITGIGGLADRLGMTPTPAVAEFLAFVAEYDRLPTQHEFSEYCVRHWRLSFHWPRLDAEIPIIKAKVEHNFYPSMIDTFHAFGLVAKAGWFDQCLLDTVEDVVSKADLTFIGAGFSASVNLKGPATRSSREAEAWKRAHRGWDPNVHQITLPMSRPRNPGNKRWYSLEDFRCIQPQLAGGELALW
jgi:hypothetical protein